MSELKPLDERIKNLTVGVLGMVDGETTQVSKTFLEHVRADMVELSELRRAQPANEPLTLEELQKGDVVWIKDLVMGEVTCLHFDRVEPATYHAGNDYRFEQFGTDTGIIRWACKYGINWLAYRHPPERSENE